MELSIILLRIQKKETLKSFEKGIIATAVEKLAAKD